MYNQSPLHANPVILNLFFHVYMYVQILNELAVHDVYTCICMCKFVKRIIQLHENSLNTFSETSKGIIRAYIHIESTV